MFGGVRRHDTWQLNADYWWDRCGQGRAPKTPNIWIAGCGTMQPYVFRLANPHADILATDLSSHSLRIAERRCDWHGAYGIAFGQVDLTDESQMPEGPFDAIECYGVLMNLEDPLSALRAIASRLSERGVLRVMVYPHYSRRRIFQIQRIAQLLGLRFDEPTHPRVLRTVIEGLPIPHPLRYAFDNYSDARNDEGLVDGFLHAGDRGFRGLEFGALCEGAGLRPAFWFHRPWADPTAMAAKLGLDRTSQFFVLHYLDLWQELRGNYVVCLVRADAEPVASSTLRPHPMLELGSSAGPTDWLNRVSHRVVGVHLPSRTGDATQRVSAPDVRRLPRCVAAPQSEAEATTRLRATGALLGGEYRSPTLPPYGGEISHRAEPRLELGPLAANPFYAHLFEAWATGPENSHGALVDLLDQVERWGSHADPLEDGTRPFGLTAFATFLRRRDELERYFSSEVATVDSWSDWPLAARERDRAREFARAVDPNHAERLSAGELAELWSLLFAYDRLLLGHDQFD